MEDPEKEPETQAPNPPERKKKKKKPKRNVVSPIPDGAEQPNPESAKKKKRRDKKRRKPKSNDAVFMRVGSFIQNLTT